MGHARTRCQHCEFEVETDAECPLCGHDVTERPSAVGRLMDLFDS